MKRRHALIIGFGIGGIAILAVGGILGGRQAIEQVGRVAGVTSPAPTESPAPLPTPLPSRKPEPSSPGPRTGHVMVYDPENHGVILFGGSTTLPQPDGMNLAVGLDDTWLWDGKSWTSLDVHGPSARSAAMAVYDTVRHEVVLFGGSGDGGVGPGNYLNDTWTWDGNLWHLREPVHRPDPRMRAGFTFDQARGEVVMVGGEGAKVYISTWTWDGTDWTLRDPATNPTARRYAGMAYSPSTRTSILYGGTWAGRQLNDSWIWDGSNWRRGAAGPAAGITTLTYDSARDRVVGLVYTPAAENTSVAVIAWNGVAWSNESKKGPLLGPRVGVPLAYDAASAEVVLYGGSYIEPVPYAETWVWRGAGWFLWQSPAGA
ncbi:MAG TPA: hypothetical protein VGK28_02085 [Candidatus Dormibacteraeota bacterium]